MMSISATRNSTWFIDMDGTPAKWRVGFDNQIRLSGYFRSLKPTSFLPLVREFASRQRQMYILCSYLTGCQALQDKQGWMDEHFPEIPQERRLFVPCGTSKTDFVMEWFGLERLTEQMVLFDDVSKNLHKWKAAGGKGVKCYNGINGTHGTWTLDGAMWSSELKAALEMSAA